MASSFEGKWQMVSSENFDEYMKALGAGFLVRKAAGTAKPVQEIRVHGNKFAITTTTTFKTIEQSFTIGEEFDEVTADDRKVKSLVTLEDDGRRLVHRQTGEPDVTMTRQLDPDGQSFTMKLQCKGVTSVRGYKKIV